tara:strand:+ start:160 stop:582 length:423 start_codon:yes stop_codon:yes gene_type:complete
MAAVTALGKRPDRSDSVDDWVNKQSQPLLLAMDETAALRRTTKQLKLENDKLKVKTNKLKEAFDTLFKSHRQLDQQQKWTRTVMLNYLAYHTEWHRVYAATFSDMHTHASALEARIKTLEERMPSDRIEMLKTPSEMHEM